MGKLFDMKTEDYFCFWEGMVEKEWRDEGREIKDMRERSPGTLRNKGPGEDSDLETGNNLRIRQPRFTSKYFYSPMAES